MFKIIDNYLKMHDKKVDIIEKFKLRFCLIMSFFLIIFIASTIIPKIIFTQYISAGNICSLLAASLVLYTILSLPFGKGVKLFRFIIFSISLILIPLASIELQSNSWVLVAWSIMLFKCVRFEFNFKLAIITLLVNIIFINYGMYFTEEISPLISNLALRIFLNFGPPFIFILSMELFESLLRDELLKELKEKEELQTINQMITTLRHEINNPLTISLSSIHRLKKDPNTDPELLESCEKGLLRIQKLVTEIENLKKYRSKIELSHSTMYDLSESKRQLNKFRLIEKEKAQKA